MSIQHTCSVMVQSIPNVLAEVWDMLEEGGKRDKCLWPVDRLLFFFPKHCSFFFLLFTAWLTSFLPKTVHGNGMQ